MTADHDAIRALARAQATIDRDPSDVADAVADALAPMIADRAALAAQVARLTAEREAGQLLRHDAYARGHLHGIQERDSNLAEALDAARARVADLEAENKRLHKHTEDQAATCLGLAATINAWKDRYAGAEAELAEARDENASLNISYEALAESLPVRICGDITCACVAHDPTPTAVRITPPEERNPVSGLIGLFTTGPCSAYTIGDGCVMCAEAHGDAPVEATS